jgi:bifunctional DNA-binding transcriptional regulator/antitoxin component of YhaV-PrlF toxin-antitoxin module
MSKVTSKLQVSLPKALAERYGIRPGDDIKWEAAGDVIRVIPADREAPEYSRDEQLSFFDQATLRQQQRQIERELSTPSDRGWSREDLYERRGSAD